MAKKMYLIMIQPETLPEAELKRKTAYIRGSVIEGDNEENALQIFNNRNGYRLKMENVSVSEV